MKKNQIFTIPNLLSLVRLALIPLIMWLYLEKESLGWTAATLVLSGATDILDGFIARKFHMISELGKALDPVADKLTQIAMLYCLATTHPEVRFLLLILVVKEVITGAMSLYSIKKTKQVQGADWHGKVTTVLIYVLIIDRIVPQFLSCVLTLLCIGMMILSMVLYWQRNWNSIKGSDHKEKEQG